MILKNVKKSNFDIGLETERVVGNNHKLIEEDDRYMQEKAIKRNCRQIARGVLIHLNIHAESKSLIPILENYEASNNFVAITDWVYNVRPEQDEVSEKVIAKLAVQLRELIFEYMES